MLALAVLADPTRRRIVELLAEREMSAGEIVDEFDMTGSAVSQHLKALREARWVTVRVDGQRRIHSLDPAGIEELEAWLAKTRRFWDRRLDVLTRELKADDERTRKKKS